MSWLRLYTEITKDRKIRRIPAQYRWIWIAVLCMAKDSPEEGKLLISDNIPADLYDIADEAGVDVDDVRKAMEIFIDQGMVEFTNNVYIVKNWDKRQYKSDNSSERVRRYRSRLNSESEISCSNDVSVSMQNIETLQERYDDVNYNVTETLQKRPQSTEVQKTDIQSTDNNKNNIQITEINNSSSSSSSYNPPPSSPSKFDDDDDDKNFSVIAEIYRENFGFFNHVIKQSLYALYKKFGEDMVLEAINIAAKNKANGIRYIEKLFEDWVHKGIKTANDLVKYGKVVVLRSEEDDKNLDESQVKSAARYIEMELTEFRKKERSDDEIKEFLFSKKFDYPKPVKLKALELLGLKKYCEGEGVG